MSKQLDEQSRPAQDKTHRKDILVSSLSSLCEKYCASKPTQRVPRALQSAAFRLRRLSNVIITRPDKGNGVILLDKNCYLSLLNEASVSDTTKFRAISSKPPKRTGRPVKHYHPLLQKEKDLSNLLTNVLPSNLAKKLCPKGSRLARLYGLPKTHKPRLCMRPILSATATYNYDLAKWLDTILKPLATNRFMVQDTFSFVHELSSLTVKPTDVLVSYDVVSLFTSVPLDDTVRFIVQKALKDDWLQRNHGISLSADNLAKLLYAATRHQLFEHNGQLYEQFEGVAMGSPLGPLMANAFMCMPEERLDDSGSMPSYYRRYVDDTIAIFPSHLAHEQFLAHLNTLHPSIRFTAELADNGVLPFIGVNCLHTDSTIQTSVYHKPTDTGLLLHYHSHVDSRYKRALLRTMITRAYRICSSWHHLHSECKLIHQVFGALQYPAPLIDRTIREVLSAAIDPPSQLSSPPSSNESTTYRMVLPYKSKELCTGLRSEIRNLNHRLEVKLQPVFTSTKVKRLITSPSPATEIDRLIEQAKVVYCYRCSCDMSYIGYTSRHLHQRIAEHRRSTSAIFQHCSNTGHDFRESNFSIIAKCSSKFDCMVREAHEIYFSRPALNARDEYSCSALYRFR